MARGDEQEAKQAIKNDKRSHFRVCFSNRYFCRF